MRAFLVDDEPLAVKRLSRMLAATKRVEIVGQSSDPEQAVSAIRTAKPDVLFLDIEMPGMTGFEMLSRIEPQPLIVFTTAYGQYALEAFGVNSIDYLLKPIEAAQLDRALDKIERMRGGAEPRPEVKELLARVAALANPAKQAQYPDRVASRIGSPTPPLARRITWSTIPSWSSNKNSIRANSSASTAAPCSISTTSTSCMPGSRDGALEGPQAHRAERVARPRPHAERKADLVVGQFETDPLPGI